MVVLDDVFDPLVAVQITSTFNTKCYVMNNEEKLFQSLETLFLLMKKTRAKKFKVRMFYHLQTLFLGVFVRGFCLGGFCLGGFCPGGFVLIPFGLYR